jgi:glycosyltransferase involved in cell wall biosynthesis
VSNSLTVIVPTYNRADYVRRCLTALKQSGVPDLQVIVADDGSTDDTKAVVAATNPSGLYLWQPNSGTPATARNAAFALVTGRYVGFLDCDDEWLPGVPAKVVALLDRHPDVDVLFADARMGNPQQGFRSWIEEAGQKAFFELPHREVEPGFRVLERGPFFRRVALRSPLFIGAMVMRREAFERAGMFDPALRGAADWDLWLRMAHRFTFGFLAEPLAVYTRHRDNMSSDHDRMYGEFCQALRNAAAIPGLSADERRYVAGRLRQMLYDHAYLAYDRGDVAEARGRFRAALRAGDLRPVTAALWLTCWLPGGLVRWLRGVKRAVTK